MANTETFEGRQCLTCGGVVRYKISRKCVTCKRARSKAWYDKRAQDRSWVEKEKIRKSKWRTENIELARELTANWEHANKDRVNAKSRVRRAQNPEKYRRRQNAWRSENTDKVTTYSLRATYSMELEEYQALLVHQKGLCAICGKPEKSRKRLSVDHCHETGAVRGLLCTLCNTGIGMLKDDPHLVLKALRYLVGAD